MIAGAAVATLLGSWGLLVAPFGAELARALGVDPARAAAAGPIGDWVGGFVGPVLNVLVIGMTAYLAVFVTPRQVEQSRVDGLQESEASKLLAWVVTAQKESDSTDADLERRGVLIANRSDQAATQLRMKLGDVALLGSTPVRDGRDSAPPAVRLHFVPPGLYFVGVEGSSSEWTWGEMVPVTTVDGVQRTEFEDESWRIRPESYFTSSERVWGVVALAFNAGQRDSTPLQWQRDENANLSRVMPGDDPLVTQYGREWEDSETKTRVRKTSVRAANREVQALMGALAAELEARIEFGRVGGLIDSVRQSNMGPIAGGQSLRITDARGGQYWFAGNAKKQVPANFGYEHGGSKTSRRLMSNFGVGSSRFPTAYDAWAEPAAGRSTAASAERRRVENLANAIVQVIAEHQRSQINDGRPLE